MFCHNEMRCLEWVFHHSKTLNRYHPNQITRKTSKKSVAVVHQNTGSIVYMLHFLAENEEDQNKTFRNKRYVVWMVDGDWTIQRSLPLITNFQPIQTPLTYRSHIFHISHSTRMLEDNMKQMTYCL